MTSLWIGRFVGARALIPCHTSRFGHCRSVVAVVSATCALGFATTDLQSGDIRFTEVTAECGVDFVLDAPVNTVFNNGHFLGGVGVADFDGNGALDLYFTGGGGDHDHLYLNDGDGNFTDASEEWGLVEVHFTCGVGAGDIDGDGWIDLVVSSAGDASVPQGGPGAYRLYRNINGTHFEDIAQAAGVANVAPNMPQHPTFATPGDYDADGDLDLFYGSWQVPSKGNRVYRNNGDSTFTDVTESLGFDAAMFPAKGWSVDVVDMDGDLHPDILWVADFHDSAYYRNNGDGTFTNMTPTNGTGTDRTAMGAVVFDANADGRLDWFVSCIWYDDPSNPDLHNGNALYVQIADHQYVNLVAPFAVNDSGWSWSSIAADFDQDGIEDLAVANGTRVHEEFRNEPEYIFQKNTPNGNYYNVTSKTGLGLACEAVSAAAFDLEGDGDLDLVFVCNDAAARIYRNDSIDQGSWLQIELGGNPSEGIPNNGFNTRVEARVGETVQTRYMDGRPSYGASGPQALHFGFGDAEVIDELTVRWINGEVTVLTDVPVNQKISIDPPGEDIIGDLDGNGVVNGADLTILLGWWGDCAEPIEDCVADINEDGQVDGADLSQLLGNWTTTP